MTTRVHSGRIFREDRISDPWPTVEFGVPDGCAGITVELEHDTTAGVVIDLGCQGPAGWRGWSGGARRRFAITPSAATPGYLPGELEPGIWQVVLGLHRVPAAGAEYTVRITLGPASVEAVPPAPPVSAPAPDRPLPASTGLRWVAADLHAHTLHSDGMLSVPELAALAVSRGLAALAVTDHNTVSHHAELAAVGERYGIALVPGQEITTEAGHANAFGEIGWVDFRRPAATWVSIVDERGGVLSVNHPLAADCAWRHPLPVRPPLAEVWHSSWQAPTWGGPLAWWRAWGLDTAPVGGSDWHRPGSDAPPGSPTTWVAADADARGPGEVALAVLDGLRAGRTAVSAGRHHPVLLPVDGELVVLDGDGTMVIGPDGRRRPVRGNRAVLSVTAAGGHVLLDHDGGVLSLATTR